MRVAKLSCKIPEMKLSPGTKLKHYEIRGLLGKGGMGEVYLAEDTKLSSRKVAVKILDQTNDHEKLRRFQQEARAVSALNHPNILTIYEFDRTDRFHFIVAEYIKGETLREILNRRRPALDEIFEITIQIGNALAAAHEVGIIHRDIKPENIMVLPDGYVKVLDFGLAKLQRAEIPVYENQADAPTASVMQTEAGLIIGTVNYMSPEQVRGQKIDERADIWAMGAVFYEMLAGERPFSGESVGDTIAAILQHSPPKLKDVPPEAEALAAKALEKKKEDRLATARDFVNELKKLKTIHLARNFAAQPAALLPTKAPERSVNVSFAIKNLSEIIGTKPRGSLLVLLLIFGLIFSAGALTIYYLLPVSDDRLKQIKVTRLSTAGNTINAVISPDGRFIAYIQNDNNRYSLRVRQTDQTAGNELFRPESGVLGNLTFAPDGDSIYVTKFAEDASGTLYRIPFFGGSHQEILKDIDSAIAFAPGGKKIAFLRSNPAEGVDRLMICDPDGGNQQVIAEKQKPFFFVITTRHGLAWAPDGNSVAVPVGKIGDGEFMSVARIEIETGREQALTDQKWSRVGRVVWIKEENTLLLTAAEFGTDLYQIVRLHLSSGKIQKITNEISDYFNISLDNDAGRLLATVYDKNSVVQNAKTAELNQTRPIAGGGYDGIGGIAYTGDGRIVFTSIESGNPDIWVMNEDGSNRRQLTFDKAADERPVVARDNRTIVFGSNRTGAPHIWRMNFDGGELRQLTNEGGETFPQLTPDGKTVIFSQRRDGRPTLWKVSIDGGVPTQITTEQTHWAAVSPDGKFLACLTRGSDAKSPIKLAVVPLERDESSKKSEFLHVFEYSGDASELIPPTLRWLPDGKSIVYTATPDGFSNVFAQPLAGGKLKKLTDFSADRIFSFDLSPDGSSITLARGVLRNNLLLITDF